MANTKQTARKQQVRCPLCTDDFESQADFERHMAACMKLKQEELQYVCRAPGCKYAASRKYDYERHMRRKHDSKNASDQESDRDLEDLDPGNLSAILGDASSHDKKTSTPRKGEDLELGIMKRKATHPAPVQSTKRRLIESLQASLSPKKPAGKTTGIPKTTATVTKPADPVIYTEGTVESGGQRSTLVATCSSTPVMTVSIATGNDQPSYREFGTQTDGSRRKRRRAKRSIVEEWSEQEWSE